MIVRWKLKTGGIFLLPAPFETTSSKFYHTLYIVRQRKTVREVSE